MLMDLLQDHRTGQDETQLCSFVLGGRTEWGTYKQALRELYKRVRGVRQAQTDLDLLLIDIEEKEELLESLDTDIEEGTDIKASDREKRRETIKLRQKYGQLEEANRSLTDTKREAAIFYREASALKKKIGELTEERRRELDRDEWKWFHIKRAAIEKITTGRVGDVVLKNLCSLPCEERKEWAAIIKDDSKLIAAFETSDYGKICLDAPSLEDIKLLEVEINKSSELDS